MPNRIAATGLGSLSDRLAPHFEQASLQIVTDTTEAASFDAALIGPDHASPAALATKFLSTNPHAQIVFFAEAARVLSLRSSLPFIPYLASAWVLSVDDSVEALLQVVEDAALVGSRRRDDGDVRQRINESLTKSSSRVAAAQTMNQIAVSQDYPAAVTAQAPDGLIALSSEGVVLAWNQRAAELLERPATSAIGVHYETLLAGSLRSEVERIVQSVLEGDRVDHRPISFPTTDAGGNKAEVCLPYNHLAGRP